MKIRELLLENISSNQVKIEELEDGTFKVSVDASGGPLIQVIRTIAFSAVFGTIPPEYDEDDESEYEKLNKARRNFSKLADVYTVSSKKISAGREYDKFKAKSCIIKFKDGVKNQADELKKLVDVVIKYENEEITNKLERKRTAPERKKLAAKLSAEDQKIRREKLYAKYGKKVVDSVKIKQIGGDDGYQWNVLVNGRSIMNGLTQSSARYEQELQWKRLSKES